MAIAFDNFEGLERLLEDASTPLYDREFVIGELLYLAAGGEIPVGAISAASELAELYELQLLDRGHIYGMLLEMRFGGWEAVAYYRIPPIIGYDRADAITRASILRAK